MITATEIKNGVHVHTKVSRQNKRLVEVLSRKYELPENVVFNAVIEKGLAAMKANRKTKR